MMHLSFSWATSGSTRTHFGSSTAVPFDPPIAWQPGVGPRWYNPLLWQSVEGAQAKDGEGEAIFDVQQERGCCRGRRCRGREGGEQYGGLCPHHHLAFPHTHHLPLLHLEVCQGDVSSLQNVDSPCKRKYVYKEFRMLVTGREYSMKYFRWPKNMRGWSY